MTTPPPGPLPLDGFTVLDLTQFLAGPYCTMVLAELGADVIKVERFPGGDDARRTSPQVNGESYPFAMANRSKRSLALDLKTDQGREVFLRLARRADAVTENFRPGVADRLGVGYEAVRAVRPDIIYCSISGFGQSGPYRDRAALDIVVQGVVGFLRMTGQPGGPPTKMGIAATDMAAGSVAIYSVLAAHILRQRTGEGQHIDVSLVDAGLANTVWESGAYFGGGEIPEPAGTRHRRSAPYQALRTADGHVTVGANNDRLWRRLATEVLGRPDLLADPRFATPAARMENLDDLEREIEAITSTRSTAEWVEALDRAGVPGGPVLRYDESLQHPHVAARGMLVDVPHPVMGSMRTVAPPAKFSGMSYAVRGGAPWLGQHTADVLRENGYSDESIAELFEQKIVFDARPEMREG